MPFDPAGPDDDAGQLPRPQAPEHDGGTAEGAEAVPLEAPDPWRLSTEQAWGLPNDRGREANAGAGAFRDPYYHDENARYTDVPASLELDYSWSDVGLSAGAFEHAMPYEEVQRRRRRASGTRMRRIGRELAETVILALLIFFAVKAVVQNFRVEGASMEPTMHNNDYLLVNKALYFRVDMDRLNDFMPFLPGDGDKRHLFRAPQRGDVVVFRFPLDPNRDFIKRVIGVPGDTVEVRDETVYINGSPLAEDYILSTPNYTYGPRTVPEGMYFVLGDNRRNSFDSHAWGSGCTPQQQCDFVPEENIIGQAWISYWPYDSLGFVNNHSVKPSAP